MVGRILAWTAAVLIGAVLGLGSLWAVLNIGKSNFTDKIGRWSYSRAAGSEAAGPYTRAMIAQIALLALNAREAKYYTIWDDDQGRPLSESCIYELNGRPMATRWWSVTLYAKDNFLAQNTDHAASVDASRVIPAPGGNWAVRISPVRGDAPNWISSRDARRGFSLTLRLYNTERDFEATEETLPVLTTVSCTGDGA